MNKSMFFLGEITKFCFSIALFLGMSDVIIGQDIYINEICSSNSTVIADDDGDYSDWIEFYNAGEEELSLAGYRLTDDSEVRNKWVFPDVVIKPKSYLIVFASGKDRRSENSVLHTSFKISQDGELIIFSSPNDTIISFVPPVYIPSDESFAKEHNSINFSVTNSPSPSGENISSLSIVPSHKSGFYTSPFEFSITQPDTSINIRYTLNGNTPDENSRVLKDSILISGNSSHNYNYSSIPTTPLVSNWPLITFKWKEPQSVNKGTIVRFSAFKQGKRITKTETLSFWVDETMTSRYSLPIISIVTDSSNFFDYETGIYIPGKVFDEKGFDWIPTGNYHETGKEWERPIHISHFSSTGESNFETNAGVRMKGYGSAAYVQKSMNIFFRKEYGQEQIEVDLFNDPDKTVFNRFVLRNSGNDFPNTHFRDGLLQSIISDLNLDLQACQPAVTFFNGEYWGIYNIRDKYDEYYFSNKYNIDKDDVNLLEICGAIETGDNKSYLDLLDFVSNNDLSTEDNYEYVLEEIDIDNFVDFMISEIYYANYDWPCNNYKVWKSQTPGSKWRFVIYDLDLSFNFASGSVPETLSLEHATNSEGRRWPYCPCSNSIFRNLLDNEVFVEKFIDRFVFLMQNNFNSRRILDKIEEMKSQYYPEMEEHIQRWNYPKNLEVWEEEIDKMRDFAILRPCFMKENIINFFNLDTLGFDCLLSSAGGDVLVDRNIEIYPSITQGEVTLINDYNTLSNESIYIYNSLGEIEMYETNVNLSSFESKVLDLSFLSNGIYVLSISLKGQMTKKRIIINR